MSQVAILKALLLTCLLGSTVGQQVVNIFSYNDSACTILESTTPEHVLTLTELAAGYTCLVATPEDDLHGLGQRLVACPDGQSLIESQTTSAQCQGTVVDGTTMPLNSELDELRMGGCVAHDGHYDKASEPFLTSTCVSTTTTTSEMPWGLPWWAWFLICCGILLLCALCCLPLLGGGAAMGSGKKKSKKTGDVETVTTYEVVDEPDAAPTGVY
mmetsp:Transcript_43998/g.104118  ORF Transcript_43998/g.104118 Transcript_43998/m.104118 type:complete len:214 (+) Transcript_43998:123-764(+)|eukprot:CAMPEP_0178416240 /NCGR_PEP_ID=MMETSP0689_2-20121128/23962_1 /TAXON_ID=160604 /ORGANISM="Amphidinium massartii, Strain CS-259" /LENGTH=213 /DNA_ID=CAMNT_0020037579 /DNA_START=94 /DNA_END=735 /DNA_ORIENTATION=+